MTATILKTPEPTTDSREAKRPSVSNGAASLWCICT